VSRLLLLFLPIFALTVHVRAGQDPAPGTPSAAVSSPPAAPVENAQPFDAWLGDFKTEARGRGFSEALLNATVGTVVEPLPQVIQSDRNQAELNPGFDRYLNARLTRSMTTRGREMAREHATVLARIERTYNVQRRFLLAIWGMESRFGRLTGRTPVFQALATLAWEPRRSDMFRNELYNALMMVDRGYIDVGTMTGSWAGAMGQTQFMPTSYMNYAVDFDGDGHRDIWQSNADVLASIANYLKGSGWNGNETWGREVRVPAAALEKITSAIPKRTAGCYALRNMTERRPLREWTRLGVTRSDGGPLPTADVSAGLVDVGARKFLVYPNYDAILGYNCAHYYALTVALIGDALR
jgi:membrane-bound lytic murein transglycosylase B